ncbi:unnamed protein product [Orchesella dallaii]|uniref:F-box domain-containing protein n=1 Tax=Orchesella dallaii TaxID=48710 RepID=A0ABP1S8I6_9HEXA
MDVKPEENTGVQVQEAKASHADNIGEEEHDSVGSSRPVPVLPPEIWARIFEFCSTRNDVIAVMTTCKQWNHLASSKKTTVLLPLVLPFVIERLQKADILACRRQRWISIHLPDPPYPMNFSRGLPPTKYINKLYAYDQVGKFS